MATLHSLKPPQEIPPEPPHSIEMEQALLGALLLRNDGYAPASAIVGSPDFYDPLHARIFSAIGHMIGEGRAANPVTLAPSFASEPHLASDLTVTAYLGRLVANTISLSPLDYARGLKDLSRRRHVAGTAEILRKAALRGDLDMGAEITGAIGELDFALADMRRKGASCCGVGDKAEAIVTALDEPLVAISTGLNNLDRKLIGYRKGQYYVLGARPSMGKSAIAASSLLRMAQAGHGVGYFSLEMTAEALTERCMSDLSWAREMGVPYVEIQRRNVAQWQRERLVNAAREMRKLPFIVEDEAGLTVSQVATRARRMAQLFEKDGKSLDVICVDHLGKLSAGSRYHGNKVAETGEISSALASMAKELDTPVLALCQLSRQVENREDKRPLLADLRWSGDIEQDADVVMFLYRRAYYLERARYPDDVEKEQARIAKLNACRHEMELLVEKNRSGPTGQVRLYCDMPCNVVRDAR